MVRWLFAASLMLFLVPLSAAAQQTGSGMQAGSGLTMQQRLDGLHQRMDAVSGAVIDIPAVAMQDRKDDERRDGILADCALALREAGRDERFAVLLRCTRSLLAGDALRLQALQQRQSADSGEPAKRAVTATAALARAVQTIVSAIDAGVYDREELLLDAKHRLFRQYRLPALHADLLLRADRHRRWLLRIARHLATLETHGTMDWLRVQRESDAVLACIEAVEPQLASARAATPETILGAAQALSVYERSLASCLAPIQSLLNDLVIEMAENRS